MGHRPTTAIVGAIIDFACRPRLRGCQATCRGRVDPRGWRARSRDARWSAGRNSAGWGGARLTRDRPEVDLAFAWVIENAVQFPVDPVTPIEDVTMEEL